MANTCDDFTKGTGRDIYFEQRRRELERVVDPSTGRVRAVLAEEVRVCPLCDSPEHAPALAKACFEFRTCKKCGFIFSNPRLRKDALMSLYRGDLPEVDTTNTWVDVLLSERNMAYDKGKYERGLDLLEARVLPGRLLDVGCSIGFFLKLSSDRGWTGTGLELNERATAHARDNFGVEVRPLLLEDLDYAPGHFRAVTLWGVIEHLPDPVAELRHIHSLLEEGGLLLTFCPNVESLACRVLREKAATFDGLSHYGYFSPRTLEEAFGRAGFALEHFETHQASLDPILNHLNGQDPYRPEHGLFGDVRLNLGEDRKELEDRIVGLGLGYKMLAVARKVKP